MSTEQKLHLAAITSGVAAFIFTTLCLFTGVWNGLWVLAVAGFAAFALIEAHVEIHYGREAWAAAHEEEDR